MCQKNMSNQLEKIFQKIHYEISTVHVYRQLYDQVYGSESVIEVVNDSAKLFFAMNQRIFIDNIILSIARLLDPAESSGFENLSLQQLVMQIRQDENSIDELIEQLNSLLSDIQNLITSFKKHRNKRIAHLDLKTIQNESVQTLPEISENNLDELLGYLDKFMNAILRHYRSAHHDYFIILPRQSDGTALIYQLIKGQAYQKLEDTGKIEKRYWTNIYPDLP